MESLNLVCTVLLNSVRLVIILHGVAAHLFLSIPGQVDTSNFHIPEHLRVFYLNS